LSQLLATFFSDEINKLPTSALSQGINCDPDPISASLVKQNASVLVSTTTNIIHLCLLVFHLSNLVHPLKKETHEENLANYCSA
jgi:hypothetical protein